MVGFNYIGDEMWRMIQYDNAILAKLPSFLKKFKTYSFNWAAEHSQMDLVKILADPHVDPNYCRTIGASFVSSGIKIH